MSDLVHPMRDLGIWSIEALDGLDLTIAPRSQTTYRSC